jgi:hypothetical protein
VEEHVRDETSVAFVWWITFMEMSVKLKVLELIKTVAERKSFRSPRIARTVE